jgi:uncharacterized protein (DUF169 family)
MSDYERIERDLMVQVSLRHRPVAVTTLKAAPPGVEKFEGVQPSGCSFWRLASQGRTFYTVGADHYNCPIGSHTHNIPLPPERAHELTETLGFMTGIGYLRMEEVPSIPRLPRTPGVVVYAPLGKTPVDPDVVLFWGPPGRVMLLQEAANRSGVAAQLNTLGRPTCMVVPAALENGVVASTGCVGNRVYTGLDETDLYVAVPGRDLLKVAGEIATITMANNTLLMYHQDRKRQLAAVDRP